MQNRAGHGYDGQTIDLMPASALALASASTKIQDFSLSPGLENVNTSLLAMTCMQGPVKENLVAVENPQKAHARTRVNGLLVLDASAV